MVNPHPEGSAEYDEFQAAYERTKAELSAKRAANPVATQRNITVTVSVDAINAAKALAVLSGMPYRLVLGTAAQNGVEALVDQVQRRLTGSGEPGTVPGGSFPV